MTLGIPFAFQGDPQLAQTGKKQHASGTSNLGVLNKNTCAP